MESNGIPDPMEAAIIPTDSDEAFLQASVTAIERAIRVAIGARGQCILGLSGGSTPVPIYERLGQSSEIDWGHVHLFLVDDRCVPLTDERSNARMVGQTLLAHADVPDLQRYFPDTLLPPAEAAAAYDKTLQRVLADTPPDVVVLGMGEDGHVASLFPPLSPAVLGETACAIHTQTPIGPNGELRAPVRDRITVTPRVLRTAETKIFLLSGATKKAAWAQTIAKGANPLQWPASVLLHHAVAVTKW